MTFSGTSHFYGYILNFVLKQVVDESENISIDGSDKIPWHDVSEDLPRPDCDKWNHWNSLMFSFTAITTIGTKQYL